MQKYKERLSREFNEKVDINDFKPSQEDKPKLYCRLPKFKAENQPKRYSLYEKLFNSASAFQISPGKKQEDEDEEHDGALPPLCNSFRSL